MALKKIFNDPIYGFISFPFDIIYHLIEHPYFQRLRRISQVGLSSYVYPGATHSRFHHALGATHLCVELITVLRSKGADITEEEYEACCIATLLHDIGHGPFSHALEHQIIPFHHEELTIAIMEMLNKEYSGKLTLAIEIFQKTYPKKFLSSIISSQLDVDRMDYLNRDSFYTGVTEGKIGYERIIKMMRVHDGKLVVELKGLHSVEKFLLSRYFMYRQVYLHKTAIAAEQMLKALVKRYAKLVLESELRLLPSIDDVLINYQFTSPEQQIGHFLRLDDTDIYQLMKHCQHASDTVLKYLSEGLLNRNLHKTIFRSEPFTEIDYKTHYTFNLSKKISFENFKLLVECGTEQYSVYCPENDPILLVDTDYQIHSFLSQNVLSYDLNVKIEHFMVIPR